MDYFASTLRKHPELAIFLTIAAGFLLGRLRVGSLRVGNVLGTLIAGIVIGQLDIHVPAIVQVVFFDLFLFATGYKVGPQFVRGLGRGALPQVALALVVCLTGLLTTVLAAKILGYDPGTAAGLLAGAFTTSTIIGTASEAINRLGLPQAQTTQLVGNIAAAYTVSCLIGTSTAIYFLASVAPRLFGKDLKAESQELEHELSPGSEDEGKQSGYREWDNRAYRLAGEWAGKSVADLEQSFAPERVFVKRIRRHGALLDAQPAVVLLADDIIALTARRRVVAPGLPIGTEVEDRALLEFPMETRDAVVTNKAVVDRTVASLANEYGRGVALLELIRQGEQIPFTASTKVNRGDLLRLAGATEDVDRAGRALGYLDRSTAATDVVFVGLGIVLGGAVGVLSITVRGLPITLGASGGVLIMGLIFGWLRSVHPTFGRIPEAALWVLDTVGLAVFIGLVGLGAGPGFLHGLARMGLALPVACLAVVMAPYIAALLFGHFVLKLNPVMLLGASAGAGGSSAALRSIQDAVQSTVPVIAYTVPYAISNVLLTALGPVVVALTR